MNDGMSCKWLTTFESVDELLHCDLSKSETSLRSKKKIETL